MSKFEGGTFMYIFTIKALTLFILVSCGSDDSSTESIAEEDASTEQILGEEKVLYEEPVPCAENKLCPGMTREEVLELLGDPIEIIDYGFAHEHWWAYDNDDQGVDYCHTVIDCRLRFNRDGNLVQQQGFAIKYLDIMRWNE